MKHSIKKVEKIFRVRICYIVISFIGFNHSEKNIQIEIYSRSIIQGNWSIPLDTYCQNWQTVRAYLRQRPYYDSPIEEPLSKFCYLDYCPRCCYLTMSMVAVWWTCPRKTAWKKVIMLENRHKDVFKIAFQNHEHTRFSDFRVPCNFEAMYINIQYGEEQLNLKGNNNIQDKC